MTDGGQLAGLTAGGGLGGLLRATAALVILPAATHIVAALAGYAIGCWAGWKARSWRD